MYVYDGNILARSLKYASAADSHCDVARAALFQRIGRLRRRTEDKDAGITEYGREKAALSIAVEDGARR